MNEFWDKAYLNGLTRNLNSKLFYKLQNQK
jgi:hypothetical protein